MPDANREGLRAAAEVFARVMRYVASIKTDETARAVNVRMNGNTAVISGGHEGGQWGWEPIQGAMFDDNGRHPLFGNKGHWYRQGKWPITATTVFTAIDSATEAYADAAVPILLEEYGFKG